MRLFTLRHLALFGAAVGTAFVLGNQTQARGRQSQQEMNQEAGRDFEKADAALNKAYAKLSKSLEAGKRQKLKTAQQAWIKFRDAEALFRGSEMEGGSAFPMLYAGYKTQLTKKRTAELNEAFKQFAPK